MLPRINSFVPVECQRWMKDAVKDEVAGAVSGTGSLAAVRTRHLLDWNYSILRSNDLRKNESVGGAVSVS